MYCASVLCSDDVGFVVICEKSQEVSSVRLLPETTSFWRSVNEVHGAVEGFHLAEVHCCVAQSQSLYWSFLIWVSGARKPVNDI